MTSSVNKETLGSLLESSEDEDFLMSQMPDYDISLPPPKRLTKMQVSTHLQDKCRKIIVSIGGDKVRH
jgi:hypothetical protein